VLFRRKVLSADTEAAKQDSVRDDTADGKEKESSVSECCIRDGTLSSSLNSSSPKPDNFDASLENSATGHVPNSESTVFDSDDINMADNMETGASLSKADVDKECTDECAGTVTSDAATNVDVAGQCSPVSAVQSNTDEGATDAMQSSVDDKCIETVAETQSSAAVCDDDSERRQTDASNDANFEQTVVSSCTDCSSSDENRLLIERDTSVSFDSESTTDLPPHLSRALMNEVN